MEEDNDAAAAAGHAAPDDPTTRVSDDIGARFRRPLTDEELAAITAAARRQGPKGGLDGAVRATWDILLRDAEGMSMAEATERGLRFHPRAYAIPQTQHDQVAAIWRNHRGPGYPDPSIADLRWFQIGPSSFPDEPPPAA